MLKDLEILKQFEEQTGRKFIELPFNKIYDLEKNEYTLSELKEYYHGSCAYSLDNDGNIFALLIECPLSDIFDYLDINKLTELLFLSLINGNLCTIPSLSKLVKLQHLDLKGNKIIDTSFLSNSSNLRFLNLGWNQIENISYLSELNVLNILNIKSNNVSDISPLQDLTNLTFLDLSWNQIYDISILAGLSNLNFLNLGKNQIKDIFFLSGLKKIKLLNLSRQQITDISFLTELTNLEYLDLSFNKIIDISFLSQLLNIKSLSLYNNLVAEISCLINLTSMKSLDLEGNQITDISHLSKLINLSTLNLNNNQIKDIAHLVDLTNLKSLDLGKNRIIEISYLSRLINLKSLILNDNQITDISYLLDLTNLKFLNLESNRIKDIFFLSGLINLESLSISENKIKDFFPIASLFNLKFLRLRKNQMKDISFLTGLIKLESLDLQRNEIINISYLTRLINLEKLDLSFNQINDVSFLSGLTILRSLDLRFNQINEISSLSRLNRLESFYLCRNLINIFPEFVLEFEKLVDFDLSSNPVEDIEQEFLEYNLFNDRLFHNSIEKIKDYYTLLDARGYKTNQQVKLLLLGNGRVGKTSIMKSLFDEELQDNEPSTHGITQRTLCFPTEKYPELQVQIWDFGGQEIYFGTHRLFMNHKTLYFLVWDNESETTDYHHDEKGKMFPNYPIAFWLDYISTFSPNSPIILIRNKDDDHTKRPHPQYQQLKEKYKIVDFIDYSAKNPKHKLELIEMLIKHLESMPQLGRKIPKPWYNIRQELQKLAKEVNNKYIEYNFYHQLCKKEKISEISKSSERSLLEYLHATGVLFYDEKVFDKKIILDQKWAVDAINTLFDREHYYELKSETKGVFTRTQLNKYVWENIPIKEQVLYLEFMQSCDLCFPIIDNSFNKEQIYVVPQLLPENDKKQLEAFKTDDNKSVYFIYDYKYFHIGIFHRFIARIAKRIRNKEEAVFYSNLISLSYSDNATNATIFYQKELGSKNCEIGRIIIKVNGNKRAIFLHEIKEKFKDLNQNTSVNELVSIDYVNTITYEKLNKNHEAGITEDISIEGNKIKIKDFDEFINIPELDDKKNDDKNLTVINNSANQILNKIIYSLNQAVDNAKQQSLLREDLKTGEKGEDKRTNFIKIILQSSLNPYYHFDEQNKGGISGSGNSEGNIDIAIFDKNKLKISLIEALIHRDKKYFIDHFKKSIKNYNQLKHKFIFIITYCETNNFDIAWRDYLNWLKEITNLKGFEDISAMSENQFIKILDSEFQLDNDQITRVYHLFVDFSGGHYKIG